ncbi:MAG: TM2 domain-containing protein [Polaribacter sp.]
MKNIILCLGLVLSTTISTVEAAIPVRKNLVETSQIASTEEMQSSPLVQNQTTENLEDDTALNYGSSKSHTTALLLCFFLGGIGIHRFYLGYTWQGVVQLLTFGGLGIWSLIDFIRIVLEDLQPKDGRYS